MDTNESTNSLNAHTRPKTLSGSSLLAQIAGQKQQQRALRPPQGQAIRTGRCCRGRKRNK